MKELLSAVFTACVAVIAVSFFRILIPSGHLAKTVRITAGLCITAAVLSCFSGGVKLSLPQSDISVSKYVDRLDDTVRDQLSEQTSKTVETSIKQILRGYNIKNAKVYVTMDKTSSGGIYIDRVRIMLSSDQLADAAEIAGTIEESFGCDCDIERDTD